MAVHTAPPQRRGAANSTFLCAYDIGIGLGGYALLFRFRFGYNNLLLLLRLGLYQVLLRNLLGFNGGYVFGREVPVYYVKILYEYAAGVQLAVLTNKDHISAAPLIEKYFGSERFALVQGRVDAFPPKPEAPVTLHVMEELGANPATTLYVGDSNVDILTGHNAGLKSAGVSWGFRGRAELEAAGADYVVDTQAELAALVLGE